MARTRLTGRISGQDGSEFEVVFPADGQPPRDPDVPAEEKT